MNLNDALLQVKELHDNYINSLQELLPILKEEILNLFKEIYKEVDYFNSVEFVELYLEENILKYNFYCEVEKSTPFVQSGLVTPFRKEYKPEVGKEYFVIEVKDVPFKIEEYLTNLQGNFMIYSLLTSNDSSLVMSLS